MKILDRYILTTYLKTFFSVFIILMMIFVLQTIWLFIKELAGKDLDILVIFKFLLYYSPKLIPLVLPLTILLSSIMVFGNFAENYEFAAMKSTGISLQRAMAGLSIFIIGLGIVTFFFANNVIPWGEYNSYNLRKNIAKLKPAMVIAEGQFNEVGSINIKVEKKTGDKGQFLHDVVIHKKPNTGLGNYTTIVAKEGELIGQEDSDILKLILKDGYYYDDTPPKKSKERRRRPFTKSAFDVYTINTDLSQLNDVDLEDKNVEGKYNMLNVSDLNYTIDSLALERQEDYKKLSKNVYNRYSIKNLELSLKTSKDTVFEGNILDLYDNDKRLQITELAINSTASTKQILVNNLRSFKTKATWLNKHVIALHEKLSLGFACVILFFVGAPLGALIRKGGLGLPMIIAILLFLTYHFIGIFAKNSSKDGTFSPVLATWFSTIIMFPLGVFLTRRATADKGLFEFDHILIPLKKIFKFKTSAEDFTDGYSRDFSDFKRYKEDKLLSIIKDPTVYNYHESGKIEALYTLEERNLSLDAIRQKGIHIDASFEALKNLVNRVNIYSKIALIFNITGIVLLVLFFILKNNKMPDLATICIQLSIISFLVFLVYYSAQQFRIIAFNKHLNQKNKQSHILLTLLGFIIYPVAHVFFKYKTKTDLSRNAIQHLN
ncbi:YjgP/YjgQ family permease [Formosa sediminum]|uniref:YjgP/YjgQ family permease n=1 Tax=Formosa sediminum TaxID=2594004 RepID=A0A516GRC2_9FLAO|nr:LptF/LptG family permease [Formosa sediminum]QDO94059.1 YjgP/YjgQ family permease [Formosa sediminum]